MQRENLSYNGKYIRFGQFALNSRYYTYLVMILIKQAYTYRILFDESNKGGSLDFDGLAIAIVQCDYKVKEIRFA